MGEIWLWNLKQFIQYTEILLFRTLWGFIKIARGFSLPDLSGWVCRVFPCDSWTHTQIYLEYQSIRGAGKKTKAKHKSVGHVIVVSLMFLILLRLLSPKSPECRAHCLSGSEVRKCLVGEALRGGQITESWSWAVGYPWLIFKGIEW